MSISIQQQEKYKTANSKVTHAPNVYNNVGARTSRKELTKNEWIVIICGVLIFVSLVGTNLFIQYKDGHIRHEMQQYINSTSELEMNSDALLSEIMEQYNYSIIKEAAEEANMSIDSNRIKDVSSQ